MINTNNSHTNYSCRNSSSEGSGITMGWDNKPDDKLPHEVETKKSTGNNIRELRAKELVKQNARDWYKNYVKVIAKSPEYFTPRIKVVVD